MISEEKTYNSIILQKSRIEEIEKIKKEIEEFNRKYNTLIELAYDDHRAVILSARFKV